MKTILVVEDSRVAFEILRRAFEGNEKYSVEIFCRNGENLLKTYEEKCPDLVVMDIVMENANGVELTRTLTSAHPEARVVVISCLFYQEIIDSAIEAGAVGYIHKPFRPEQVVEVFDKALL